MDSTLRAPGLSPSTGPGTGLDPARRLSAGRCAALVLALALAWTLPARAETLRLLAIRVDFQPDQLSTTSGDGRFESAFRFDMPWAIDPLPHDSLYFDSQLRFLEHYYSRVSNNSLQLEWEIWPRGGQTAYTLPQPMWHYHWNDGDERTDGQLAELFRAAWAAADADPALRVRDDSGAPRFDAFLVFHAGVGQDFGEDGTPHDIPSAFLSRSPDGMPAAHETSLRDGESGLEVPVRQGLILPEGENHTDFEHGLAGLLILQFGHQLGLPNLYDSRDGTSVIGKWGLMDQGSANFRGLLPARPDAWSRLLLGWDTALLADTPRDTVRVAAPDRAPGEPRIVKIPLTEYEYLLVENRQRKETGRDWTWGRDRNHRWARLKSNYSLSFQDTLGVASDSAGALVAVGNLDFDLPGQGLLIWHVDERSATPENVTANRVNDDPERRGVDLEEGDGVQDIGREYGLFSPRGSVALGGDEDPWQQPNTGWYLSNRHYSLSNVSLAWDTEPSTASNDGLFTGLRLDQFGPPDSLGHFRLGWDLRPAIHGDSLCPALDSTARAGAQLGAHVWSTPLMDRYAWLTLVDGHGRCYGQPLEAFDESGPLDVQPWIRADGYPSPLPADWQDGLHGLWWLGGSRLLAQRGDSLALFRLMGEPLRYTTERFWSSGQAIQGVLATGGGREAGGAWNRAMGLWVVSGHMLFELDPVTLEVLDSSGSVAAGELQLVDLADGSGLPGVLVRGENERLFLAGHNVLGDGESLPDGAQLQALDALPEISVPEIPVDSLLATALLRDEDGVTLFHGQRELRRIDCANLAVRPTQFGPDPGLELLFQLPVGGARVYSQGGTLLAELPLADGHGAPLTGSRTDDGGLALLAAGPGRLTGLDGSGEVPANWPRVWEGLVDGPLALPELALVLGLGVDGRVEAWQAQLEDPVWTQPRGFNGSWRPWGSGAVHAQPVREVRENPAFIWPSPARDEAHVRFLLAGPARVTFTAYDTAGDRVARLEGRFERAGEQELHWLLADVAPGAYFCVLEAAGASDTWTRRLTCAVIR